MAIGGLGKLVFICSDEKIQTFRDLKVTKSLRWATHDIIGQKPLVEYIGPGLDSVSLQVRFDISLGAPPEKGLDQLKKMLDFISPKTLVIGDEYLGKFVIDNIEEERQFHDGKGHCIIAQATINLTEWGGD